MVQRQVTHNKQGIQILLIGDPGVGKTSIINSLVDHAHNLELPARLIGVTISAKVNPEHIPIHVEDFSAREQSQDDLNDAISNADAVCIVYTSIKPESFERVFDYWIPTVRRHQRVGTLRQIILVNNKTDLASDLTLDSRSIARIRDSVDGFIQVSASSNENVAELFYLAQKTVIYPKALLYDSHTRNITEKCRAALIEIFNICDLDNDDILNDSELNLLQENCFGTPLQKDALDDLKSVIKQSTSNGILNNGITQEGFLFLHTLSIDNGQPHFTWQVLKKYNYDHNIDKLTNLNLHKQIDAVDEDLSSKMSSLEVDQSKTPSNLASDEEIIDKRGKDKYEEDSGKQRHDHLDLLTYYNENSKFIKAGFGFTLVTVASMLAFRYLVHGVKNL